MVKENGGKMMENVTEHLGKDVVKRTGNGRIHWSGYYHEIDYCKAVRSVMCCIISLIGLYLIWELAALYIGRTVVPTPEATWDALKDFVANGDPIAGGTVWTYAESSVGTLLKGFILAVAVAYPFGLLLGSVKFLRDLSNPAINVLRPIAPVAWAPVLVILLGSGSGGAALVVFIGVFFPLLTSVMFGLTKVDRGWIDATRTMGATRIQTFTKVIVPASLPYLMTGMKTGMGIGWMCIVSAELYASSVGGLGNFITNQAGLGAWPYVYAGIVIVGVLGLLSVAIIDLISRRVDSRWGVAE